MPEHVTRTTLLNIRLFDVSAHQSTHAVGMKGPAFLAEKQCSIIWIGGQFWPRFTEVLLHSGKRSLADRDNAIFLSFPPQDENCPTLPIQVVELQMD